MGAIRRREFIASGALAAGALAFSPAFLREALAAPARVGAGPYGPLVGPDQNGLMLPAGFKSREVARGFQEVAGYPWHVYSDGQAAYTTRDSQDWIVVSNSESIAASGAGSSAIRFGPDGAIKSAYRILAGTNLNCAGGPTPWGTWLSCEEHPEGLVWESDPAGVLSALPRPALGSFNHEAAAVDRETGHVYLTEDEDDGGFYRFTPVKPSDLTAGKLEVASVAPDGRVSWHEVPDPNGAGGATRGQVPAMTPFDGGEGIWYARGVVYFTTKGDRKVWAYNARTGRIEVIFDRKLAGEGNPLTAVDNVTISAFGDIFVCEDGGNMEIGLISAENTVSPFVRFAKNAPGEDHGDSEVTGVVFSPNQQRMYFGSQGAYPQFPLSAKPGGVPGRTGPGAVFEVTGPFRIPTGGVPADFIYGPPAGEVRGTLSPLGERRASRRFRIRAARRVVRSTLLRRGLGVRIVVNGPTTVDLVLRTHELARRRPERGNPIRRPTGVTLARKRVKIRRAGTKVVRLRLSRRGRRRLAKRRKPVSARLLGSARGSAGTSAAATRTVRIGRAPRRRRRARRG